MSQYEEARLQEKKDAYTTLVELERASFRAIILINGAAAVALLAFLGNVWSKSSEHVIEMVAYRVRFAMLLFVVGVFLGAGATIASFLGSLFRIGGTRDSRTSNLANRVAILLVFGGLLAFLVGSVLAVFALT